MKPIEQQIKEVKDGYMANFEEMLRTPEDSERWLDLEDDLEIDAVFLLRHCYGNEPLTYRELYQKIKKEREEA